MLSVNYRSLLSTEAGFRQVYMTYYPRLLRFAAEYVVDEQDAEDIVQEVFITLWEKRDTLREDTNLTAYMMTLVKSLCLNFLKHKQIVEAYSLRVQEEDARRETMFNYYSINKFEPEQMDLERLERMLLKAISELPEQCRRVFKMSRYKGMKNREIADRLNISLKTVEMHISLALKSLRAKLRDVFL